MLLTNLKLLLVALFTLWGTSLTTQTAVKQNYTEDLLRRAKAAEMSAFFRKGEMHCENFYKEVCGNWKLTYPATSETQHTSYLDQIHNLYVNKCLDLLKAEGESRTYHRMLKNFFNSCSDEKSLAYEGLRSVLRLVDMRGGWPNISSSSWYESEYDWLKIVGEMRRKLGLEILIGLEISPNLDGKGIQRIQVGAPALPLGDYRYYLHEDYGTHRDEYKQSITTKLRKHFPKKPSNWADEVASQVLEVEKKLAKGLVEEKAQQQHQQGNRERTVAQLKLAYGSFVDLDRYLALVFNRTIYEPVYESSEVYMSNLMEVIKDTPKLTIANYTVWRVLEGVDFAGQVNDVNNDVYCAQQTIKYFPKHMEDMYDQGYNAITFGQKINSLFEELRETLKAQFNTLTKFNWMSSTTRQKAIEKIQDMKADVVHYYHVQLEQEISEIYPAIKNNKYFENLLNILEWRTKQQLSKLNQKLDATEEEDVELPKYIHKENKVRVPVEFLQPRFLWDPAYPNALKYSTIGVILSQQIINGFVGEGQEYDKRGDPNQWWDTDTKKAFDERLACFSKQYSNYRFQGKSVHDPNASIKAVIDAGALSLAYQTFHRWMNTASADVLGKEYFPNIDHKPHQLFFLGFGQMYCADYYQFSSGFSKLPERLRVNGALSNLEEFGIQFNCVADSKMNPKNKCVIF